MERLIAAADKMHQVLVHLSQVLPGASGIGSMLAAIRMDLDAAQAEMAGQESAKAPEVTVPAAGEPKAKKAK